MRVLAIFCAYDPDCDFQIIPDLRISEQVLVNQNHSPEATVTTIWKMAICKWGISFLCSELQKEMPPLQMAVFKMVFTIASGLCHFIEKNTKSFT